MSAQPGTGRQGARQASSRGSEYGTWRYRRIKLRRWIWQNLSSSLRYTSEKVLKKARDLRESGGTLSWTSRALTNKSKLQVSTRATSQPEQKRGRRRCSSSTASVDSSRRRCCSRHMSDAPHGSHGHWNEGGSGLHPGPNDKLVGYIPETVGYYTGPSSNQFQGPPQYQRRTLMVPVYECSVSTPEYIEPGNVDSARIGASGRGYFADREGALANLHDYAMSRGKQTRSRSQSSSKCQGIRHSGNQGQRYEQHSEGADAIGRHHSNASQLDLSDKSTSAESKRQGSPTSSFRSVRTADSKKTQLHLQNVRSRNREYRERHSKIRLREKRSGHRDQERGHSV